MILRDQNNATCPTQYSGTMSFWKCASPCMRICTGCHETALSIITIQSFSLVEVNVENTRPQTLSCWGIWLHFLLKKSTVSYDTVTQDVGIYLLSSFDTCMMCHWGKVAPSFCTSASVTSWAGSIKYCSHIASSKSCLESQCYKRLLTMMNQNFDA